MPATPMKVYSWTGSLWSPEARELLGEAKHHVQAHWIVAAKSKAAVGRLMGEDPRQLFCLGETGNDVDCAVALAEPGRVFIRTINGGPKRDVCIAVDRLPEGRLLADKE